MQNSLFRAVLFGAFLGCLLGGAPLGALAQSVPQGISYQAVARNGAGAVLANQAVKLRLSLCPNVGGTAPVYVETQSATTSALGLLNVTLGQGTVVSGTFAAINWGAGSYWVKTEIDADGGVIIYQDLGTTQLLSVPYALYAKNSATPGPAGAGYGGTSTSSVAIGNGTKTFVTQAGMAYGVGQRVRASSSAAQYVEGVVSNYVGTSLSILVDRTLGTGTLTSWSFGVAGDVPRYAASSVSTQTLTTGSKVFPTVAGLGYTVGQRVRASYPNTPTIFLEGVVNAYVNTSLSITIDRFAGTGSYGQWNLNLAGEPGVAGATGPAGPTGPGLSGGVANKLPKYTGAATVTNSQLTDDGTNVGVGLTTTAAYKLDVNGDVNTAGILRVGGQPMAQIRSSNRMLAGGGNATMTGTNNLLIGLGAGTGLTTGTSNVVVGTGFVFNPLTTGTNNTFIGNATGMLTGSTQISSSTAVGSGASVSGSASATVVGAGAYASNAANSVALGTNARAKGARSVAIGDNAEVTVADAIVLGAVVPNSNTSAPQTRQPFVGIGTTAPTAPLMVKSKVAFATGISNVVVDVEYSGAPGNAIAVRGICAPNASSSYGTGGDFQGISRGVTANARSSTLALVFPTGVSVLAENTGTGATAAAFGVSAAATASGTAYGVYGAAGGTGTKYAVYASGNLAYSGTLTNTSDRKLKRNIEPMPTGTLSKLLQLRPVTYEMRTDEFRPMHLAEGPQVGLIAQELAAIFPELVKDETHPGEDGKDQPIQYKGVNYTGLTPILIKAVQEQQALIEALTKRIEQLEKAAR